MGMIGNSLAMGLISGANIQDGTVDTVDLKDYAVTPAKVASGMVVTHLGFTPANKAGDTLTGDLAVSKSGNAEIKVVSSGGSAVFKADAPSNAYDIGLRVQVNGTLKWLVGMPNNVADDSFSIFNANTSSDSLSIDKTTNHMSMAGSIGMGVFVHGGNSGEARFGRGDDRSVGVATLQLGGTSGQRFEIIDKAWSAVLFSVEDNGTVSASGNMNVSGDLTAGGYKAYRYRGGLGSSDSITSAAVNSYSGAAYEGWWTLGFSGHSEGLEVRHMRGSCGTTQWYHSYGAKPAYRNKTDDSSWNCLLYTSPSPRDS